MDIISSLLSGIIAAILATLIIWLINTIWKTKIEPWYENKIYQDARIEGRWKGHFKIDNEECEEIWEIQRTGHTVTGTIISTKGPDVGKKYQFEGTFRNLILTATYTALNPKELDRGSQTLMLKNNGNKFSGQLAYYHTRKNEIGGSDYECEGA